jgi:hypothetical protein
MLWVARESDRSPPGRRRSSTRSRPWPESRGGCLQLITSDARRLRSGSSPRRAPRAADTLTPMTRTRVPLKPAHPAAPPDPEVRPRPDREGVKTRVPLRMPLSEQFRMSHADRPGSGHAPALGVCGDLRQPSLAAFGASVPPMRSVLYRRAPFVPALTAAPPHPTLRGMTDRARVQAAVARRMPLGR